VRFRWAVVFRAFDAVDRQGSGAPAQRPRAGFMAILEPVRGNRQYASDARALAALPIGSVLYAESHVKNLSEGPMVDNQMVGRAYIFLLRFGIYVDPTTELPIKEVKHADRRYRFYPPFRDKPLVEELREQAFAPATMPVRPNRRPAIVLSGLVPPPFVDPSLNEPAGPAGRHPKIVVAGRLDQLELPPPDAQPRNRFRVDVYGPALDDNKDTLSREFVRFLALLRWRTGQWWIGRPGEGIGVTTAFAIPIRAVCISVRSDCVPAVPEPSTRVPS
jgi:hypothetical protein